LTDSVRGVLRRLAVGAQSALDHLKPEGEGAVMIYAASASLADGFTSDHARTVAAINRAAATPDPSNKRREKGCRKRLALDPGWR
jgi:hypothetical protein